MATTMRAWEYSDKREKIESSLVLNKSATAPDDTSLAKDQLLIRVITAAINPVDLKVPEADWFGRTFGMEKGARPGLDFCGRIIAKHASISDFAEGEVVFGALKMASRFGALGDFLIASRSECAVLPDGVDPNHAAAVGIAAVTAWQSLLPAAKVVKPGSKVFINGGSGGVGAFAIQFAKILGAEITTTCSTRNVELCKQLGAHGVWDYKHVDIVSELRRAGQVFDLAIDNVGSDLHGHCHTFLTPSGTFVQVAANPNLGDISTIMGKKLSSLLPGKRQRSFHFVMAKGEHDDYVRFGHWLAEGRLKVVVDEEFEMENVPQAYKKLRAGHARGKLIVHVYKG